MGRQTPPASSRWLTGLLALSAFIVVVAVSRQILPSNLYSRDRESLAKQQERLAIERTELQKKRQSELELWERKNSELEKEIATLERRKPK